MKVGLYRKDKRETSVSAVIATRDRPAHLLRLIEDLHKQSHRPEEIVVVDDSGRLSLEELRSRFPKVRIIRLKRQQGAAAARNEGMRSTFSAFIWFLDDDVRILGRECLKDMLMMMRKDEGLGSIGGYHFQKEKNLVYCYRDRMGWTVPLPRPLKSGEDAGREYVQTCNALYRREAIERAGGFRENLAYLGEDKDLGMRVSGLGFSNRTMERTAAMHLEAEENRLSLIPWHFLLHRNRMRHLRSVDGEDSLFLLPLKDILEGWRFRTGNGFGWRAACYECLKRLLQMPVILAAYACVLIEREVSAAPNHGDSEEAIPA